MDRRLGHYRPREARESSVPKSLEPGSRSFAFSPARSLYGGNAPAPKTGGEQQGRDDGGQGDASRDNGSPRISRMNENVDQRENCGGHYQPKIEPADRSGPPE